MKLIFDIIKSGKEFPNKRNFHFNMSGGTIGRSEQCTWHLVDSQSIVSNNHAKIEYKDNMYFITDTSTNGTFLKHPYKKLPKNISIKINSTDIFIVGEYEIQARFIDNDYSNDDIISYKKQIHNSNDNEPIQISEQLIPNDDFLLGDSSIMNNSFINEDDSYHDTNVMNLFKEEDAPMEDLYDFEKEPFLIENSSNTIESVTHDPVHQHINMPTPSQNSPQPSQQQFVQPNNSHIQNIATNSIYQEADYHSGVNHFDALEKKLGIKLNNLPKQERDAKLSEIGQIVLNTLDGLKYSLETNAKIKKDLMISTNNSLTDSNPIKMGQYAINILNERGDSDSIKISEAIKKSYNEINTHNIALHRTSKNLINITLNKFSPKSLENHFESTKEINNLMPKKYQMWDAYTNMFSKMQENPDFGISMIAKEFSNEYNNICYTIKLTSI